MKQRYSKFLPPLIFFSDLLVLNIALQCARLLVFSYYSSELQSLNFALLFNLSWISIASLTKNYVLKRPLVFDDNMNKFFTSIIYHMVMVLGVVYFFKLYEVSRWQVFITYLLFFIFIIIERSLLFVTLDYIRKRGYNIKHVMAFGDPNIAAKLKRTFSRHPEYGYNFINSRANLGQDLSGELLFDEIIEHGPDEVFICYKNIDEVLLQKIVDFGDQNSIKIKLVSDLVLNSNYAHVVNYDNLPVIQLSSSPELSLKVVFFKRSFDVLFSLLVMVAGLPIFILLAIITKLTSKGPVFFAQERIGKDRKPFYIYKFRSMYVGSEKAGPQLSSANDPRITSWGRFIRKSRLDELPQFWNVLRGDMSIVGPRPERQFYIDQLLEHAPSYNKLLSLKPGLTSLGQVNYGYAENLQEMRHRLRYDLVYLNNISFNSDLSIILQTVKIMTQLKGK
jgi:exopolysaccharide biosynthesis polyprenyl glycosylphosphotransferase